MSDATFAVLAFDAPRPAPPPPSPVRFELWTPALLDVHPPGMRRFAYSVFWWFDRLHVFGNRGFSVLLGYDGATVVHTMGIFPPYFRFPFMKKDDLQLGDLWTAPTQRGRGVATAAIRRALELVARPGRRIYYLAREDNVASIRAAEKAGFSRVGTAERTRRLGLRALGQFVLSGA